MRVNRVDKGARALTQRAKILTLVITVIFAFLVGRLWQLQLVRGERYQLLAEGNRMRSIPIRAPRGSIYDRNGELLATNRLAFTVSVVPSGLIDPDGSVLARLSELLDVSPEELLEAVDKGRGRPYEPIRIKRDIPMEQVIAVEENRHRLPGVFIEEEWVREYFHGETAGHLLGYVGLASPQDVEKGYSPSDLVGKSGLELSFERFLRGKDGVRRVEVNALSRPVREIGVVMPEPGMDVHLTIDLAFQKAVADALRRGLVSPDGSETGAGAAVVLDARSGEVLAMVSYPGIDPERISGENRAQYVQELNQSPQSPWLNRALRAFPPGSTFKVVTAVAALESGAIDPDTVYNATGYHKYGKRDWTIHQGLAAAGPVTIVEAMGRSTNDFFWEISLRPETEGIEGLARWARLMGLGSRTGILHHEAAEMAGLVPDRQWKMQTLGEPWYEAETMDVAIGQGFLTVTPLQMAQLYSVVANRGVLHTPRLVHTVSRHDGSVRFEVSKSEPRRIEADRSTWQALHDGLRAVVQWQRGTARAAFVGTEYDPAGKTGSAQTGREAHGWFAGFAPARDPQIVVAVFAEYGGSGARVAHIAREIFDIYFLGEIDEDAE